MATKQSVRESLDFRISVLRLLHRRHGSAVEAHHYDADSDATDAEKLSTWVALRDAYDAYCHYRRQIVDDFGTEGITRLLSEGLI